jgi:hypothetical protein
MLLLAVQVGLGVMEEEVQGQVTLALEHLELQILVAEGVVWAEIVVMAEMAVLVL